MLCWVQSLQYIHLVIFLDGTLISTFWLLTDVSTETACSGWLRCLNTKPWKIFSGTRSLRCCFQEKRSRKRLLTCSRIPLSHAGSGFNVFCRPRIQPVDEEAMENLARYMPIRLTQNRRILRDSYAFSRLRKRPCRSAIPLWWQSSAHYRKLPLARTDHQPDYSMGI